MAGKDDEFDWEHLKAGKLDEGDHDELGLKAGRGQRGPGMALRMRALGRPRRVAQVADPGGGPSRSGKADRTLGVAPFHFAHTFVSRPRERSDPREVRQGRRVVVFPLKSDVSNLRKVAEARYHKRHHCWTVPRGHPFLRSAQGGAMNGVVAAVLHGRRRDGQGIAKAANAPRRFQDYIERATAGEARRAEEVEHDRQGPISTGNIGETRAERQGFWGAAERAEKRVDSRLQCRIIAELPHWLEPEARRTIVEAIGAEIGARGLGWWAAAHRPDVAKGSDPRNFHLHVGYHDRPVIGREVSFVRDGDGRLAVLRGDPIFDARKDREARGEAWVVGLKKRYAEIVNAAIEAWETQTGRRAPFRYFPGSYAELGIEAKGQRHLGPSRTALERVGILTHPGRINVDRAEQAEAAPYRRVSKMLQRMLHDEGFWGFPEAGSAFAEHHARLRRRIESNLPSVTPLLVRCIDIEAALLGQMGTEEAAALAAEIAAARGQAGTALPAAGQSRVERRSRALDEIARRAAGDGDAAAEIGARRADLVDAEGLEPAEAGPRRRLLETAQDAARAQFVERAAMMEIDVEAAAGLRLASSLARALDDWSAWAARAKRPRAGDEMPAALRVPAGYAWSRRDMAGNASREEDGRDAQWVRVRRALAEAEHHARLLAGKFGSAGGVATAFLAETGVPLERLGERFATLRIAALARFEIRDRGLER